MRLTEYGFLAWGIAALICLGCGSVGYRIEKRMERPVLVANGEGGCFFVRSVVVECHATGYEADFSKAAVAGLTPERLNRFLTAEYPAYFSVSGQYPLDLLAGVDFDQNNRDLWIMGNIVTLMVLPLPVFVANKVAVECVGTHEGKREVLLACDGEITLEMRGWGSPWPTGCITCPFKTDTPKETLGLGQDFLGHYNESAHNLLAEQVSRHLVATMAKSGFENVKRKIVLHNLK